MKKNSIVLVLGVLVIPAASCFHAFAARLGPPPGPPHGGGTCITRPHE
jgi:hypothetical protein